MVQQQIRIVNTLLMHSDIVAHLFQAILPRVWHTQTGRGIVC